MSRSDGLSPRVAAVMIALAALTAALNGADMLYDGVDAQNALSFVLFSLICAVFAWHLYLQRTA